MNRWRGGHEFPAGQFPYLVLGQPRHRGRRVTWPPGQKGIEAVGGGAGFTQFSEEGLFKHKSSRLKINSETVKLQQRSYSSR